ncbi:stabilizer of axonemal microtubules 2 isoform X2 [Xiphias gladius]|uniref:stabilizer of axonemal microtubules 2 isoform X2 n=1 Tax=Xiphias gladius TaxID=8245 RepID=UPI001A98BA58|nr:stabilizer of axonemal microtubules 2 isoform X2 [Xiphias gladius]
MRQGNRQHSGSQRAPSMRKHSGTQRAQTRASMTTEYRERFVPPRCHTTAGTSTKGTTFRSLYITQKWIKTPPKAPQPSLPPKGRQKCSSAPHDPSCLEASQLASKVEDYTTVYKNDFRAWEAKKRQPIRLIDSLKVSQGLVVTSSTSKERRIEGNSVQVDANSDTVSREQERQPFGSITSYRSDYITHPVQPRTRREKPANRTNKSLLSASAASSRPKLAWQINRERFDGASEFFQQFKTWSLETKFHGQGEARVTSPPADHNAFLSSAHRDYTPHECQRTKPTVPSVQSGEKSREPFQATTTMKEDYKAWDTPRRFPIVHKEKIKQPKKTPFSGCTPKPAESCKTNPKPFRLHPKLNETAVCNSSCTATKKPQCPAKIGAFSGFESISTGTGESRVYWSTSSDKGGTRPNGDICDVPSQHHQIIGCLVSSRS